MTLSKERSFSRKVLVKTIEGRAGVRGGKTE
jgi:hypothetical protein